MEEYESPDGTVKKMHNGNCHGVRLFPVPAPPDSRGFNS